MALRSHAWGTLPATPSLLWRSCGQQVDHGPHSLILAGSGFERSRPILASRLQVRVVMVAAFVSRAFRSPVMRSVIRALAAALVSGGLLAGCAGDRDAPMIDLAHEPPTLAEAYRLSVGEKLKVTVFGEADISGTFEIGPRGTVAIPLIGTVAAEGSTLEAFRNRLRSMLAKGFVNEPKVAVEIVSYRPIYVHGEVRTGGEFAFKAGARIRDAVAMAGGYSYRAEEGYVLLTRPGYPGVRRVPAQANLILLPGDNIRVPERFF